MSTVFPIVRYAMLPNAKGFIGLIERAFLSNANASLPKRETVSEMNTCSGTKIEINNESKGIKRALVFSILLDLI